jgi:hypothetical protein
VKVSPNTLSIGCALGLAACGFVAFNSNGCSFLDSREYDTAQRGPAQRIATTTAATAPAVANVANSTAAATAAATPIIPAAATVAAPAALVGAVAHNYGAELDARLAAIDEKVSDLQSRGIKVTRGQVETESLVAMIGAIAAAFGFGRYQYAASNGNVAPKPIAPSNGGTP